MGVFLEGQTQDSIFSHHHLVCEGLSTRTAAPARFNRPRLPSPCSQSKLITHSGPTPITRPLTGHTNVMRSNHILLGSRGGISKVKPQRMTHISAALPALSEDSAAETPVGGGVGGGGDGMCCACLCTPQSLSAEAHASSRFRIVIRILGEESQQRHTDLPCIEEVFTCSGNTRYLPPCPMVCSIINKGRRGEPLSQLVCVSQQMCA